MLRKSILIVLFNYLFLTQAIPILENNEEDYDVIEIIANSLEENAINSKEPLDTIDLSFFGKEIYGSPDTFATGKLVANYVPASTSSNPEELGSYLEGDILVPSRQGRVLTKNGVATQSSRWPKAIVPYEIRGNFNSRDLTVIEHAIAEYHKRTCIRFVPRRNEKDYVSIVSGNSGCWSAVGRVGGKQEVNLQSPGCLTKPGTAMHELMHALGFLHEQNRKERDNFVSIQYQNVQPSAKSNFDRASNTNAYGVPYDYKSVMHYSANAFSINGRPTIVATQPEKSAQMGQRDGFSPYDIEKLNKMYSCNGVSGASVANPQPAVGNNIVGSFLGGLINGLGLSDKEIH